MQGLAPGPLLDGALPTLIRQLGGDDIAEMLAVPEDADEVERGLTALGARTSWNR